MIKEYKEIEDLALQFIKEHWVELDWYGLTGEDLTLDEVTAEINNSYKTASWVVAEVMEWATETNYIETHMVALDVNYVPIYKIQDKFFTMNFNTSLLQECVYYKCVCSNMIVKLI
jgi:predicted ATP-grasp superfamily ATP-dependent carboligase